MLVTNGAHFPIAFAILHGEVSHDDVEALRAFYEMLHARNERFATLIDARHVKVPGAAVRRALADMSNDFGPVAKKNTVTVTVVIDSQIVVGALQAIRWFLKTDVELQYQTTPLKALAYVEKKLAAENIKVPDSARTFVKRLEGAMSSDYGSFAA
jgi:hypothetical protein